MLNPEAWHGSALGTECTLHQIAPYIGKMKSTMAKELIRTYTSTGDLVYDPFVGSGAIALESLIAKRKVVCTDINPYAILLTEAKTNAPKTLNEANNNANFVLARALKEADAVSLEEVPQWVRDFFHPNTLKEIISFCNIVKQQNDPFLMACLLGIMHHQRPGFLSYPSSHLVPYLRNKKYPKEQFPRAL